jgi:hypothetical protein
VPPNFWTTRVLDSTFATFFLALLLRRSYVKMLVQRFASDI